jgi:stalled ribosome rescue protein Dom34
LCGARRSARSVGIRRARRRRTKKRMMLTIDIQKVDFDPDVLQLRSVRNW